VSNGTLALVWRLLATILTRVHEKEERRFYRLNHLKRVSRKLRRIHPTKGEKVMRNTPYPLELLKTVT
jgi:hypothetical protein